MKNKVLNSAILQKVWLCGKSMFRWSSQLIVCICGMQDSKNDSSHDLVEYPPLLSVARAATMIQGHVLLLSKREVICGWRIQSSEPCQASGSEGESSNRTLKHHRMEGAPGRTAGGLP